MSRRKPYKLFDRWANRKNWDPYILNNETFMDYFYRLEEICINMFSWENLPETIDYRFLELTLSEYGFADYLNEEEVLKTIKDCYEDNGYVLDTHTACGYGVLKQYQKETGDQTKTILLSTASPYKFPESVYKALFNEELNVYDAIEKLNKKTGVAVPKPLVGIKDREVLHKTHIDKTEIINFIKSEMEGL